MLIRSNLNPTNSIGTFELFLSIYFKIISDRMNLFDRIFLFFVYKLI